MAIRFDKELNKEIRRTVDRINKKYARARKMGYSSVPRNITVREIKQQFKSKYATRRELRRQLEAYRKVNLSDLGKVVELETGSRISLQGLKTTEQRRIRLLRKTRREIKELQQRYEDVTLPFIQDEYNRLKNIEYKLAESSRKSESRVRMINEMYTREYSASKKDAFENALYEQLYDQLDRVKLDDDPRKDEAMKKAIRAKLEKADVDALIKMNREDEDVADILDRYEKGRGYTDPDLAVLRQSYINIYNKLNDLGEIYEF